MGALRRFGSRFVQILILIFSWAVFSGCPSEAPSQAFPKKTMLWELANPRYDGDVKALLENAKNHEVLVAVLDSGIDYNNKRFKRHLHAFSTNPNSGRFYGLGLDLLGKDYFPSYQILDPSTGADASANFDGTAEHGTHVAGLALPNDPRVGVVPVRVIPVASRINDTFVFGDQGEGEAEMTRRFLKLVIRGLDFAVRQGASIVNISLGASVEEFPEESRREFLRLIEATALPKLKGPWKNTLMVIAAGNERSNMKKVTLSIPATINHPDLLSVGALKNKRMVAEYSNFGRFVDVYTRGSDVRSALPENERGLMSGTSMATPLVANLAAQLKLIEPGLNPRQLRALILNTADIEMLPLEPESVAENEKPRSKYKGGPRALKAYVVNFAKARKAAKALAAMTEKDRKRLLKPPFEHGYAPAVLRRRK
ncbi:MAG: S8 family serine peptidase [Bdellovibrionota bacterium]